MDPQHLFFSLNGRISRRHFWLGFGALFLLQTVIMATVMNTWKIDPDKGLTPLWFRNLSLFLDVVCAWPLFAVLSKRQQDRGQGPNLSFVFVTLLLVFSVCEAFGLTQVGPEYTSIGWITGLPFLGVLAVVLVELGGRRGTDGPNQFGPDPRQ